MTTTAKNDFSSPTTHLISMGEKGVRHIWFAYADIGITSEHIPELIRVLQDIEEYWDEETDEPQTWAPIHAYRALGQLRATEAIDTLIELIHKNEDLDSSYIVDDVPIALGMIGPPAIPSLQTYLTDPDKETWAAISAAHSLAEIGKQHPESRETCIDVLKSGLEDFDKNDETLNGFLISSLAELKAVESAPIVGRAFEADRVDISILGDYEDFQIEVGLLDKRLTPPPRYNWIKDPQAAWEAEVKVRRENDQRKREQAKKEKRKRKQASKARRKKKR